PVGGRERFRRLIAEDVASHVIGLPVDPLAVRLVGEAYGGVSRPGVGAVDERGNDDAESDGGETPRELRRRVDPGRETRELLRGLLRVRERDGVADRP